jgi:transketolase N-terminal domain/subunit
MFIAQGIYWFAKLRGAACHMSPLTGQAETEGQCWRALQVARYVAGLARLSSRIVVRPQH